MTGHSDDQRARAGRAGRLSSLIDEQVQLMIAVATGGPRIDEVNDEYRRRRRTLKAELAEFGLIDPFPYTDLWRWHAKWSTDLGTYRARREHVRELADPLLDQLHARLADTVTDWGPGEAPPVSWGELEARLAGVGERVAAARTLDDLQDVGRRCREVLIDTANLVFDDSMVPAGEPTPGDSDAKARIDLYLAARASGSSHSALRQLVRAAYTLSQAVTHSSSVLPVEAFAAAQSTVLIVRTLQRLERVEATQ